MRTRRLAPPPPEPESVRIPGCNRHRLTEDYRYLDIFIPKGTEFEASIPRFCWSIIAPADGSDAGWLLHDWIYRHGGHPPGSKLVFTRRAADNLLYSCMIGRPNIERWRALAVWSGVRVFGGGSWKKYRPRE